MHRPAPRTAFYWYAIALVAVAAASLVTIGLHPWMGTSISLFFFPAIIIIATYGGYGPAMVATVLSTLALASFFVEPHFSFDVGTDDALRLGVFAAVAVVTASLSSARRRAEEAQRRSLVELEHAVTTLRKVSGWPVLVDADLESGVRKVLDHAAAVVGARIAIAVWEAEDEPWLYVATSSADSQSKPIAKHAPDDLTWKEVSVGPELAALMPHAGVASAPFEVEHLKGRAFFNGLDAAGDETPLVELVAREIGNSFDQLYLHGRLQQVAIREDRIRVARDLHDGVLQSLTGIRLQLQALADEQDGSTVSARLLAVERAIATEQRELRKFIEGLKPAPNGPAAQGSVARELDALRDRIGDEWKTPIVLRVDPRDMSLPPPLEHAVCLMVSEGVVNALKHAHPSRISVDVTADGSDRLHIVVSNDGRGFPFRGRRDHEELAAGNAGPVSLRERVTSLGGTLAIESAPSGSRLEITVPR